MTCGRRSSSSCKRRAQLGDDRHLPHRRGRPEIDERLLQEAESSDIPSGTVWNLDPPSGRRYHGGVLFNLDEFDESTAAGWAAELRRILASAVRDPDQDWKTCSPRGLHSQALQGSPCRAIGSAADLLGVLAVQVSVDGADGGVGS